MQTGYFPDCNAKQVISLTLAVMQTGYFPDCNVIRLTTHTKHAKTERGSMHYVGTIDK